MQLQHPDKVTHGLRWREQDVELPYSEIQIGKRLFRFSASGRVSHKRVETFTTKEPTTLVWLNTLTSDDVLVDVGANVGTYTVYATVMSMCRVYAFEPEALNYAELNKNIFLNKLYDRVRAYCCAVSDRDGLDVLYLSRFAPAYSHHDWGENRWEGPVTKIAASPEQRPRQGCMAVTLDRVVSTGMIPQPTHIKIDVDGFESKVVDGAAAVLQNPTLKSVLIETDFHLDASVGLIDRMTAAGWKFSYDQVCTSREGRISKEEWYERLRTKQGGCNIIYFRDDRYFDTFRQALMPAN